MERTTFWTNQPAAAKRQDVVVTHFGAFLRVMVTFTSEGYHLLPFNRRDPMLNEYYAQLGRAVAEAADRYHLKMLEGPEHTGEATVVDNDGHHPNGWRWELGLAEGNRPL
jgi:hypothetical protein